jgi:hypothetical protein
VLIAGLSSSKEIFRAVEIIPILSPTFNFSGIIINAVKNLYLRK